MLRLDVVVIFKAEMEGFRYIMDVFYENIIIKAYFYNMALCISNFVPRHAGFLFFVSV